MDFKEGEKYKIYRKTGKQDLLLTITLTENYCTKTFNRMLFFKYNIPLGDYKAIKIGEENAGT